jgi:hypothetical protein
MLAARIGCLAPGDTPVRHSDRTIRRCDHSDSFAARLTILEEHSDLALNRLVRRGTNCTTAHMPIWLFAWLTAIALRYIVAAKSS